MKQSLIRNVNYLNLLLKEGINMKQSLELLKKQISDNEEFGYNNLDFILDPNKNVVLYKYLRDCGVVHEIKFVIKVKEEYLPRFFDSMDEAYEFGRLGERNENLSAAETVFFHLTRFELFNVEKI
jgi:hypothetical protein